MKEKKHYVGLTSEEVLESRAKHGANVLTPPAEEKLWDKIKDCMHFWLLKVDLAILVFAALAAIILPVTGIYSHEGLWIAPVLSFILFALTYLSHTWEASGTKRIRNSTLTLSSLFFCLLFSFPDL